MPKFNVAVINGKLEPTQNIKDYLDGKTGDYIIEIKKRQQTRTLTQNGSLHLFCTQTAKELNDAGITMTEFF